MRKAVSVLLVCMLAAVFILSGCSKQNAGETGPIQIALQAPITGDYAYEGQMAKQSVEVAKELINNAGGVLGRQIEITVVDDGSNPKDSAIAAQKAVSQKVVAVIGSYGSSVTEPAADIYEKSKMVSVGYGCTAISLTMDKQRNYFFRTCGRDDAQGRFRPASRGMPKRARRRGDGTGEPPAMTTSERGQLTSHVRLRAVNRPALAVISS